MKFNPKEPGVLIPENINDIVGLVAMAFDYQGPTCFNPIGLCDLDLINKPLLFKPDTNIKDVVSFVVKNWELLEKFMGPSPGDKYLKR